MADEKYDKRDFGKERVVVALPHGRRDQLRISISSYKGRRFINLRVWYRGDDAQLRPTQQGITFQPKQLETIISALQDTKERLKQSAQSRAKNGILPDDAP